MTEDILIKTGKEIFEHGMKIISDTMQGKSIKEHKKIYDGEWVLISSLQSKIKETLEPMLIDALEECNADTLFTYDDVIQYIKPVVPHFMKSLLAVKK